MDAGVEGAKDCSMLSVVKCSVFRSKRRHGQEQCVVQFCMILKKT